MNNKNKKKSQTQLQIQRCLRLNPFTAINGALIHVQNLFMPYKADLTARIDEPVMSDEMWVFELLAKNNEEILVPVDENNEIIVKKKVVTIFNPQNYVKADTCDKHRKVKMKF